jgi:type IV secretion system protein VirD4
MRYNPFAYIHSEKDILKLVTTLIANTRVTANPETTSGRRLNAALYGDYRLHLV